MGIAAAIVASNAVFLWQQRQVHRDLFGLYRQVVDVATPQNAPLGYVNVPAWLTPKKQAYALAKDGVTGLPLYTDVRQLVAVNRGVSLEIDNVMYVHTLYEPQDAYFGFHGDWIEGAAARAFALQHRTLWLTRYEAGARPGARFELRHVGAIVPEAAACAGTPLVHFQDGSGSTLVTIVEAAVQRVDRGRVTLALTWHARAPVQSGIFLHVVDGQNALVAQADGPALGGILPPALWQPGDCISDVRTLDLPDAGGPYTVLVGLYDAQGRFPAYVNGARAPNDAAPVAQIAR